MLNKYYAKTDESVVYRIAMSVSSLSFPFSLCMCLCFVSVLHPEFKLDYFKKAKWLPEWITEARRVATVEWEAHYKSATPPQSSTSVNVPSSPQNDVSS